MTRVILILSMSATTLFSALGLSYLPELLAQSTCPQVERVTIRAGVASLRVREVPITGRTLAGVRAGQSFDVLDIDPLTCWYRIETTDELGRPVQGWITNSENWVGATPAATPSPRPAATDTPMPTPTRIRRNLVWCEQGSVTQTAAGNQVLVECQAP